jgi:hypothetical protein
MCGAALLASTSAGFAAPVAQKQNCNPQQLANNNNNARAKCAAVLTPADAKELNDAISRRDKYLKEIGILSEELLLQIAAFQHMTPEARTFAESLGYGPEAIRERLDVLQEDLWSVDGKISEFEHKAKSHTINPTFDGLSYDGVQEGLSTSLRLDVRKFANLPEDHRLFISPFIGVSRTSFDIESDPALRALGLNSAGSKDLDTTYGGLSAHYSIGPYFISGEFSFESGDADVRNKALESRGSYDLDGHGWQLEGGRTFLLSTGIFDRMLYGVFLRVSAGGGSTERDSDAFTDSAGNTFGRQNEDYDHYGGEATISALLFDQSILWRPYASVGVRHVDERHTLVLPAQGAFVGATVDIDTDDDTYWTFAGGIDAMTKGGFRLGARGFFETNGPDDGYGGTLSLAVPLDF